MFHVKSVGIIPSACICNGRRGRLLFEPPWRDSTSREAQCRPHQTLNPGNTWGRDPFKSIQLGVNCHQIKLSLNLDQTPHWYSLLQQRLKVYLHCLKGVYAFLAQLSLYCTRSWHNTSKHRLCISSASRWKSPFGRGKSIAKRTMTYSLSYDISCVCLFHR